MSRRQDLDQLLMPEAAGSQMRKVLHGMLQFNVENRSSATQTIERMEGKNKHCSHIRPEVNCIKKRFFHFKGKLKQVLLIIRTCLIDGNKVHYIMRLIFNPSFDRIFF